MDSKSSDFETPIVMNRFKIMTEKSVSKADTDLIVTTLSQFFGLICKKNCFQVT